MRDKTIIEKIVFLSGFVMKNAILEVEAQRVPGFIAIQSQCIEDATEYISLASISSMTIKNDELEKTSPAYYFSPEQKVKIER